MSGHIRIAREADARQIRDIYAPYVRDTAVTFEIREPTTQELRRRLASTLNEAPWLVCEEDGRVLGFAYASVHREREAYRWSRDCSIYVRPGHHRRGIGRALYTALFGLLRLQGFYNVYAGITLPNPASVALHEAMGFVRVGVYRCAGYKLGQWHDVEWWQLTLRAYDARPAVPYAVAEVAGGEGWRKALNVAQVLLESPSREGI